MPMNIPSILYAILAFAAQSSAAEWKDNEQQYCVSYFGNIGAELTVPRGDGAPLRNWNGTETCTDWWKFSPRSGAVLQLCPYSYGDPDAIQDATAMSVELRFGPEKYYRNPLRVITFSRIFITNGSVSGPFAGYDIKPAAIQLQESEKTEDVIVSKWAVNGTQESLLSGGRDSSDSVSLDCSEAYGEDSGGYCGTYEDRHQGGCWSSQQFHLHNQTATNFSVQFDDSVGTVDIWTAQPWTAINGTDFGDINVHVSFSGKRHLPSISEDEFWDNMDLYSYEAAQILVNNIKLKEDEAGMPLFYNNTDSEEWYAAANGTYSNDSSITSLQGMGIRCLLVSIGLILLGAA